MKPLIVPELEAYVHGHTSARPPLFDELRERTIAETTDPGMQVGRVEGALLKLLVQLTGAKRVLELGTFTGYSALCMAEGLPDDGELITCDVDVKTTAIALEFFARSPHGKKITLRIGQATDTLAAMALAPAFDLAFIDADKENYVAYYEAIVPRLNQGGLLIADNTLWSGAVLAPETDSARAIATFNERVMEDPRVENVLLSVRDGMMLARKR
jgi:caffeoyl-CoA O-methyltransferase